MDEHGARWLLAAAASLGVVGTAVAASKASFKVAELKLPPKKAIKHYIPAAVIGLLTIGCVIGANIVGDHENAVLSSALLLAEEGLVRRRDKSDAAMEELASEHQEKIKDISQAIKRKAKPPKIYYDELLWHDGLRGVDGYFGATELDMWLALYFLNRELAIRHEVSLAFFYEHLGLSVPDWSRDVGWSLGAGVVYGYEFIDCVWETMPYDDNLECNLLTFPYPPTNDYLWYTPDEDKWQGWNV